MILHRSIFGRDAGNVRFDPLFDQSGGEDYDLSRRLVAAGHTLIFVPQAKVSEPVTPARAGIAYGLCRAWRDRVVRQKYRYARHSLGAGLRADLGDIAALIADIVVAAKDTMLALLIPRRGPARYFLWDIGLATMKIGAILFYPITPSPRAYGIRQTPQK